MLVVKVSPAADQPESRACHVKSLLCRECAANTVMAASLSQLEQAVGQPPCNPSTPLAQQSDNLAEGSIRA
eukprot:1144935-Pelagomonas_calceolata.AAC.2